MSAWSICDLSNFLYSAPGICFKAWSYQISTPFFFNCWASQGISAWVPSCSQVSWPTPWEPRTRSPGGRLDLSTVAMTIADEYVDC